MQRFIRKWLAQKRDAEALYDEQEDIEAFERAPTLFIPPEEEEEGSRAETPARGGESAARSPARSARSPGGRSAAGGGSPGEAEEEGEGDSAPKEPSSPQFFSRVKSLASKPDAAGVALRPATKKKLALGEEEEEEEGLQKVEAAMMLSLAGIMLTARGMFKGTVAEQDKIRQEMDHRGVHDDQDQQQVDSLLLKEFLDGAMYTLEMVFMGNEQESAAIIAEKFEEQKQWDELVSTVEEEVLGGSLEDDPRKREQEWGPAGEEAKKLRKTVEKMAKKRGIRPPRDMTKSDWREATARQGVGKLSDRIGFMD